MWQLFVFNSLVALFLAAVPASSDQLFPPPGPPVQVPARCKNIPGSANWPSDAEWAKLKTAVGGRLLKPPAPAAGCHRNSVDSAGAASCSLVTSEWRTAQFHVDHPTSTLWQNWNNYSCSPDTRSQCSTAGYPVYVVAVKQTSDIKAAVNFAREKNIRLNIKGTGHDFLGRSIQPYSLSIWTRNLKGMQWFDTTFTPRGCKVSIPGPAVTIGSGFTWGEVYEAASARRMSVVGGYTSTVGIGGFLSNGGHGKMSAKYGYGADMVLEINLVTAAGEVITANECQNTEYFWAMRGGGGSTYGVALSYTLQALRGTSLAKYYGTLIGWPSINRFHSHWPKMANIGASAYISGHPARDGRANLMVFLANSTAERLRGMILPIIGGLSARSVSDSEEEQKESEIGTFVDMNSWDLDKDEMPEFSPQRAIAIGQATLEREATGVGANKLIASWMWSAEDLAHPSMTRVLRSAYEPETQMMTDATMGIGTQKPPFLRGGGNAINPAMRTAVMRVASEIHWEGTDQRRLESHTNTQVRLGAALRSLNPNGGTYPNEADPNTPNWQRAFWGTHYPKLLDIKYKVDPGGVFYCRSCVGSEYWEDVKGMLCRR